PAALRIKPFLTPLAAVGVAIIMILAFVYHLKHNEPVWSTVAFFAIAVFIAWGRFIKAPIRAK
ncbi:MAG: DoxX family protein, partial [Dinghuibacter sp.]|nr:DoxX family protein [Dinghuibacter sp.]